MNYLKNSAELVCSKDCDKHNVCPMVLVQNILSGKRKILILWHLSQGILRFCELKQYLPNVTQKMLTMQLRALEKDKLIYRKVYPVVPPKVEYGLTEVGKKIIPILEMMHQFGEWYLEEELTEKQVSADTEE